MERRILGTEKVTLINGDVMDVDIYAVRLSEKNHFSTKHRSKSVIGSGKNKSISIDIFDDKIIESIMNIALNGKIEFTDIDSCEDDLYNKYFNKEAYVGSEGTNSKNSNTSEQSEAKEDQ